MRTPYSPRTSLSPLPIRVPRPYPNLCSWWLSLNTRKTLQPTGHRSQQSNSGDRNLAIMFPDSFSLSRKGVGFNSLARFHRDPDRLELMHYILFRAKPRRPSTQQCEFRLTKLRYPFPIAPLLGVMPGGILWRRQRLFRRQRWFDWQARDWIIFVLLLLPYSQSLWDKYKILVPFVNA